jgi:hypothetical protein
MSSTDKTKLDGMTGGAAVSSVSGTAPITSSGGTTPAIGISAATESAAGSMSASDKTKLDGIASGATALSLANLGGGAETVGGSGGNGSATTAARSDHTHAITNPALDTLAATTDITTLNSSTSAHGLLPKLGGGTANFLRADGSWQTPPGTNTLALANLGGGSETIGGSGGNGSATTAARSDHTHAITNPGVAIGPGSSTTGHMATFSDTGGYNLSDGGAPVAVANLGGGLRRSAGQVGTAARRPPRARTTRTRSPRRRRRRSGGSRSPEERTLPRRRRAARRSRC